MGECCGGGWQESVEQALDGALQVFIVDGGCFIGSFWSVVNEDVGKVALDRPWHLGWFT